MLHTRSATEYRAVAGAAILPTIVTVDRLAEESNERRRRLAAEQALDATLADSFPASDPPSWNPGFARPSPAVGLEHHAERSNSVGDSDARTSASDIIDASRPSSADRTLLQGLVSLAGAAGIALLVPFAILLVGLPVVLAVRGVLEVIGWLFGVALL
jgi:tetrahydromethanopterin S-methyltransferase subunit F